MLICAEFLLLNTLADGRPICRGNELHIPLAGAALCELASRGLVGVDPAGRLRCSGGSSSGDPLLDLALRHFAARRGRKASGRLDRLGRTMLPGVQERLAAEGVGRVEPSGFLRPRRVQVAPLARQALVQRLADVARGVAAADLHTGSLLGLLSTTRQLDRFIQPALAGMTTKQLRRRAEEIASADASCAAATRAVSNARKAAAAASVAVAAATFGAAN